MNSLLFSPSTALLAHRQLSDLVRLLVAKRNNRRRGVDRRIEAMAREALALLGGGPDAPIPTHLGLGEPSQALNLPGVSQYALLGSVAFQIPEFVNYLGPSQSWIAEVLRHGNPDPDLSQVIARSTDLPFLVAEKALAKTNDDVEKAKIRAFAMGMFCAIAAEVVSGPILRGLAARKGEAHWRRESIPEILGAIDARLSRDFLRGFPDSDAWDASWPSSAEVPASLLEGFVEAVEELRGINKPHRPKGLALFESSFQTGPPLNAERLREAYAFYRFGLEQRKLGVWGWWGLLNAFWWPPVIGLLIALAVPQSRPLFQDDEDAERPADEKAWFAFIVLTYLTGSITPLVLAMVMWAKVPGPSGAFIESLILGLLRLLFGGLGIAGLTQDWSEEGRWIGVAAPLAATDIYAALRAIFAERRGDSWVFALQTVPILTVAVAAGVAGLVRLVDRSRPVAFWVLWAILLVLLLTAAGIPFAFLARNRGGLTGLLLHERDRLPVLADLDHAALDRIDLRALARVFDDSTLWAPPNTPGPNLENLAFPAGARPLVRIWWTGAGNLEISYDQNEITIHQGDPAPTVKFGPAPFTAADIAREIRGALAGIQTQAVDLVTDHYDLPHPITFKAHPTRVKLGKSRGEAHLLLHTPRSALAQKLGRRGASNIELDGLKLIPDASLGDLEGSALGLAGDFAALLALGAAPTLHQGPLLAPNVPINPQLREVYQVFRRWNLDERRANEWRMLVLGGAASEKQQNPRTLDEANRPFPDGGTYSSPFASDPPAAAAEATGRGLGWIPLWRAWSRVATDPRQSPTAGFAADYNPRLQRTPGPKSKVTNRELSDALRYLLELT